MNKILSIRPNLQISLLFAEIQDYQETANRNEIVNSALEKSIEQKVDWRVATKFKVDESSEEIKQPDFMQIRVDENKYNLVVNEIKQAFDLKRVTAPYLIRLILVNYLLFLKNNGNKEVISTVEKIVDFGIDCLVFKNEYDRSEYAKKELLLVLSRKILELNSDLNIKIRSQMNERIRKYSDYFNIEKYYPRPRSDFGTCNIVFVSKVLAGLFLLISEVEEINPDKMVETLQETVNS